MAIQLKRADGNNTDVYIPDGKHENWDNSQ